MLHLDKPLTVTPLQLQRMAAHCEVRSSARSEENREINHLSPQPSVPHSCVGEIWSGWTDVTPHVHATLLVHSNSPSGSQPGHTELVSAHLLGLEEIFAAAPCHAVIFSTGDLDPTYQGVHCEGTLPLPLMGPDAWSLVYTSPLLIMDRGRVGLALLGETSKMVTVSSQRIADIQVRGIMFYSPADSNCRLSLTPGVW